MRLPLPPLLEVAAGIIPRLRETKEFLARNYAPLLLAVSCVFLLAVTVPALWSLALATLLAIFMAAKPVGSERCLCLLDIGVFAFYASSCLSTAFAYDVSTTLPELNLRTFFLLIYLACRWMEGPDTMLVSALATGMIIHCIEGLVRFVRSYLQWSTLHFTSLADFRSSVTLTAAGVRPGNHAAIYIVAIAAAIYGVRSIPRGSRVATCLYISSLALSLMCVALSFSRALYVCAALCLVISVWDIRRKMRLGAKATLVTAGGAILALIVVFFCARPILAAVRDTVLFSARLSQARSISGRLSINRTALHLATHSGWIGAGLDNYALVLRRLDLMSPSLLTAHTFNVALQVAIEQGLLGVASLLLIFVGIMRMLWQHRRIGQCKPLLACTAALLLFSMTQSFVLADQATAVALAIYCALVSKLGDANA